MNKFAYSFSSIAEVFTRKAFNALTDFCHRFVDAFNTHWDRHEYGGDDEGTVESLATEGAEGTTVRAKGSRQLEMSARLLIDDDEQTLTDLYGNCDKTGAMLIKDGIPVVVRSATQIERAHLEPLLNCDFVDQDSNVPLWWTEEKTGSTVTGLQNTSELWQGGFSWRIYGGGGGE